MVVKANELEVIYERNRGIEMSLKNTKKVWQLHSNLQMENEGLKNKETWRKRNDDKSHISYRNKRQNEAERARVESKSKKGKGKNGLVKTKKRRKTMCCSKNE